MAEALDVLFDSFKFIESKAEHDEHNTRSRSAAVERINLCLLALGKTADLIADWVIVRQVFMVALAVSGCTNTCEFAGNFVCQDGEQLTIGSACSICLSFHSFRFSGARRNDHARFARCR